MTVMITKNPPGPYVNLMLESAAKNVGRSAPGVLCSSKLFSNLIPQISPISDKKMPTKIMPKTCMHFICPLALATMI